MPTDKPDSTLPELQVRKQQVENQLNQLKQTHYSLIIQERIQKVQNPGGTVTQQEQYKTNLANLATQIANARTSVNELLVMQNELDAETSAATTKPTIEETTTPIT